jgi:mono/diheme cytochrome c family protein
VTEVPEYLLERSRERRVSLGLLDDDGSGAGGASGTAATPGATASTGSPTTADLVAAAKAAAVAEPETTPPPDPDWVQAAKKRNSIPRWVLPIMFLLPLWGFVYLKLTEPPPASITSLTEGAAVYTANCSNCHLPDGSGQDGGGPGRALWNGEVLLTFPSLDSPDFEGEHAFENGDSASMAAWILNGTANTGAGSTYGDRNRSDGPHIAGDVGVMPGFANQLNDHQLYAVMRFIREALSGEELSGAELGEREASWTELGGGAAVSSGGGGHG